MKPVILGTALALLLVPGSLPQTTRLEARPWPEGPVVDAPPRADLLIRGALVVDGTGVAPFAADVAVADGRIAGIGSLDDVAAATVLDGEGLVLAPGFIDVHTHADGIADTPDAANFLRMGVTTVVVGNCGGSTVDVAQALGRIERTGVAPNVATLVGHNSVRAAVMGRASRAPSEHELARMRALVGRAMREGAVGFSTGLEYIPGTYAETPEIVALAREACDAGGLYATHLRNEGTAIDAAVEEALAVGREAACRVQISHLKIDSPSRWGRSAEVLAAIEAARQEGVAVGIDQYAYSASSSSLGIRFPSWALEGGQEAIDRRLADEATWSRIRREIAATLGERGFDDLEFAIVASHAADPSVNGKSIARIAEERRGSRSLDDQLEVARALMRQGGARMVYHVMSEEDVRRIMRDPAVAMASDAGVITPGQGMPHPRGYGNAARVLAHYVRETGTLRLEDAVRKMTSLPASHFGFEGRGRVATGAVADLVLFDPARVDGPATFEAPHRYATGIEHVLVGGRFVLRDGAATGERPGRVLRGPGWQAPVTR